MDPLLLKATAVTPLVWLDTATGTCIIAGRSMPENAAEFYGMLIAWVDANPPRSGKPMHWDLRLSYFNTSSTKGIYQLLSRIKSQLDACHKHTVTWEVEDDDEFMREAGNNFIALLGLPLVFRDVDEETAQVQNDKLAAALAAYWIIRTKIFRIDDDERCVVIHLKSWSPSTSART